MQGYKGQKYNPAEDDGITTESLFKVIDGDTGEAIDVRELLGITEEEFKSNPELLQAMQHMNKIQPIEEQPQSQITEKEEKKENGAGKAAALGNPDQKARHFKYFEMLDTLPVSSTDLTATTELTQTSGLTAAEHVIELNAGGASNEVIAWENWWTMKEETNMRLFEAIGNRDENKVLLLLDENLSNAPMMADVNAKDETNQTPLHSSIFSGDVNITKLLIERYAEINAIDDEGKSPLHLACMLGNLSMVKLLLTKPESNANIQDGKGDTPLHLACASLNDPIIRHLMKEQRANIEIKNRDGKTPKAVLKQKSKQAG